MEYLFDNQSGCGKKIMGKLIKNPDKSKRFSAWRARMSPQMLLLIGVSISVMSLIIEGKFDPFVLLGFLCMAVFEVFFRKQKKISSNFLSLICGLMVVFAIKLFVVDIKSVQIDVSDLNIKKNDNVFYKPALYSLKEKDVVFYFSQEESKNYLSIVKDIQGDVCNVYLISKNKFKKVNRSDIKGKIIFNWEDFVKR